MTAHLFVYGTLMPSSGHDNARRLARESRIVGPATIGGELYDLGRYPGLVLAGEQAGDIVHGVAVELLRPAATLPWLDAYEGVTAGNPPSDEYCRIETQAKLADGRPLTVMVYVLRARPAGARLIASGRWLAT
jgi:gamma-glutamylcyclotransferase (GGCT)/AIG2-like uncharacterized protein YtfP